MGVLANDSVAQAPFLRVRLAGTAPDMGEAHFCCPSDAFPYCRGNSRCVIRSRGGDQFQKEACAEADCHEEPLLRCFYAIGAVRVRGRVARKFSDWRVLAFLVGWVFPRGRRRGVFGLNRTRRGASFDVLDAVLEGQE